MRVRKGQLRPNLFPTTLGSWANPGTQSTTRLTHGLHDSVNNQECLPPPSQKKPLPSKSASKPGIAGTHPPSAGAAHALRLRSGRPVDMAATTGSVQMTADGTSDTATDSRQAVEQRQATFYFGHYYTSHNYTGHNYIGHNYKGNSHVQASIGRSTHTCVCRSMRRL